MGQLGMAHNYHSSSSRLLSSPCDPQGLTEARSNGRQRFLNGLNPCKRFSLRHEQEAKQESLQLVLAKVHAPEPHAKRVARAIDLAPKLAKTAKHNVVEQSGPPQATFNIATCRPSSSSSRTLAHFD